MFCYHQNQDEANLANNLPVFYDNKTTNISKLWKQLPIETCIKYINKNINAPPHCMSAIKEYQKDLIQVKHKYAQV